MVKPLVSTALLILALFLLVVVISRTAWVSDDAFITFRSVDNCLNGLGLTWNIAERVQTFTHPLWALLLIPLIAATGEYFYSVIFFSMLLSGVAVYLLVFQVSRDRWAGLVITLTLVMSKAFTDYCTSGLENPLGYVLVALFVLVFIKKSPERTSPFLLSLFAALATLTRFDYLLLLLPALGFLWWQHRSIRTAAQVVLGFTPLLLWFLFSLVYYGFPFPNTAYAKLGGGVASVDLLNQGAYYIGLSVIKDPVTGIALLGGLIAPLVSRNTKLIALAAGVFIYLLYVMRVGGDFMIGRFLSLPLFLALCIVACSNFLRRGIAVGTAFGLILAVGLPNPQCPIYAGCRYTLGFNGAAQMKSQRGVVDERAFYFRPGALGGCSDTKPLAIPKAVQVQHATRLSVVQEGAVGQLGFFQGPYTHLIDYNALGDPLLSRLPREMSPQWRIGHLQRDLPNGYAATIRTGANVLADSALAHYYDKLCILTKGAVWSLSRWLEIIRFNLDTYDDLKETFLAAPAVRVGLHDVAWRDEFRVEAADSFLVPFGSFGITVDLDTICYANAISFLTEAAHAYLVTLSADGHEIFRDTVDQSPFSTYDALFETGFQVPQNIREQGFDQLFIRPLYKNAWSRLGMLKLTGDPVQ
ncbi:MAG: hypothetical protein AB1644_11615 [Candidatus Zixiibacteriota bacterium]